MHDGLRRLLCRLSGHDWLLQYAPERLSLHCPTCGATSPGWTLRDRSQYQPPKAFVAMSPSAAIAFERNVRRG
jgi:hypothetical protein